LLLFLLASDTPKKRATFPYCSSCDIRPQLPAHRESWGSATTLYKTMPQEKQCKLLIVICLNYTLHGKKLDFTYRKPFSFFAEGSVVEESSGNWTISATF